MDDATRNDLLSGINQELEARNLKPLKKLGDAARGEIEITGIAEIYDHSKRFFTDVRFSVKFPNKTEGFFTVRWNANSKISDGAVMVVLVNGLLAVVKEWRLPLGRWMYGLPRGFGEKIDEARIHGNLGTLKMGDLPLGTLTRELGEEVMKDAEVKSITHLGNVAENSGTSTAIPSVFLLTIDVPQDKLKGHLRGSEQLQELKVELWDPGKVKKETGGKLCDLHTLAALMLASRYIEDLPKLG